MKTAPQHSAPRNGTDTGRDCQDCGHLGAPHRHGTRVAYVADGCRCTPCRAANRAAERHRTSALRSGCWQPYVDATLARAHLQLLRERGVGLDQIVKISRTPKSTIRRLMREPPVAPARIRTETAVRLTAIQISPEQLAPRSQVDATETRARIQELLDAGHAIPDLARALGKTPVSLRRTLSRSSVTAHTAAAVSNLFDELRPHPREIGRRERGNYGRRTGNGEENRIMDSSRNEHT